MALIVAAGAVFQLLMTQWERYRYPPPGKLVDIGGLRLHINCMGAGSPTVIMDSGLGDTSVIWQLVQPEVSRFTRVSALWFQAPTLSLGLRSADTTSVYLPPAIGSKSRAWCSSIQPIQTNSIVRHSALTATSSRNTRG